MRKKYHHAVFLILSSLLTAQVAYGVEKKMSPYTQSDEEKKRSLFQKCEESIQELTGLEEKPLKELEPESSFYSFKTAYLGKKKCEKALNLGLKTQKRIKEVKEKWFHLKDQELSAIKNKNLEYIESETWCCIHTCKALDDLSPREWTQFGRQYEE